MKNSLILSTLGYAFTVALAMSASTALAQNASGDASANSSDENQEIVVTAQKREQSLNAVGMTLTAVTGDQLVQQGISGAADLTKIVPGFVYIETGTGTPVYTLRGVGYVDETLSASPAVSVYVDEVPLPFSTMARAASLDLERVEVLKGPQGTLFGENSTGGAFNYIAAKPLDRFGAGFNLSYGRFDAIDAQGYITGPLTDDLKARLAVRASIGDDWQRSYSRDDSLGRTRQYQGRFQLEWDPGDRLKLRFNANGWIDKSDTQAAQFVTIIPQAPGIDPALAAYPAAPASNRAADWDPRVGHARDDSFYQLSLRGDYELSEALSFTSITAYEDIHTDAYYDGDGTPYRVLDRQVNGDGDVFYQEARLALQTGRLNAIVGGNFSRSSADESFIQSGIDSPTSSIFPGLTFDHAAVSSRQRIRSKAVFGNAEYEIVDNVTLKLGGRYTKTVRRSTNCMFDAGNGNFGRSFAILADLLNGPAPAPENPLGSCVAIDMNGNPGAVSGRLSEDNVSWRAGIDWKPTGSGLLLYANVSKGYKAGTIGTTPIAFQSQAAPITQESLLAYEAGIKAPLFGRRMQLNAALFYYDYRDKQLLGRVDVQPFGLLFQLINVPKSRLQGGEIDISWRPVDGLHLNLAATYLDTSVRRFVGYGSDALLTDFRGSDLPYSPHWQMNGGFEYRAAISGSLDAIVGSNLSYQSNSNAGFAKDPLLYIKPRTILDLRAGVEAQDGKWSAQIWARNVTNNHYWTSTQQILDAVIRYAGRPASFGVTVGFKY